MMNFDERYLSVNLYVALSTNCGLCTEIKANELRSNCRLENLSEPQSGGATTHIIAGAALVGGVCSHHSVCAISAPFRGDGAISCAIKVSVRIVQEYKNGEK